MRLGVDIDGVVADFATTANHHLARTLGVEPQPVNEWNWYPAYYEVASKRQVERAWRAMWDEFNHGPLFGMCSAIPGAAAGLWLLEDLGHEIVFITQRAPSTEKVTREWLRDVIDMRDPELHLVKDKTAVAPCDFYLDDRPENIRDYTVLGLNGWLFDQPWNRNCAWPRLHGWGEVIENVVATSRLKEGRRASVV